MTIPVADIAAYLTHTGWRPTEESWRGARVWTRDAVEVLLPVRDDLGDNRARIRDVLRAVAALENRAVGAVAGDIAHPDIDSAAFDGPQDTGGTVALPVGLEAITGLRDLVAIAARTVVEGPHLRFRGATPPVVDTLLDRIRLAFTGEAGMSCTVLVPVTAVDGLAGRDVVVQLHDAVLAIGEAAGADDASAFDSTVTAGVSAEFCLAASALAGPEHDEPFDLTFRWAHGLASELPPRSITFPPGAGVAVHAASRRLQRLRVSGAATVAGRVDGLHDEAGSTDRWRMRVRGYLSTPAAGAPRRVIWVRLPDQTTYDRVVEAYRVGRPVRAAGELTSRDDRVELITMAEEIEIVDEPEDDRAR